MNTIIDKKVQLHDLKFRIYLTKEEILTKVEEIGAVLNKEYQGKEPVFLGMLNGAFVFMADLIRAYGAPAEMSFIRYSSYKGTKSTGKLKGELTVDKRLKGKDIILVEDIIDTGSSMHQFLPILHEIEPASVKLVSLLFKEESCKYPVHPDLFAFNIPSDFVVGYGLDYKELGRNLADIYVLSE